MSRFQNRSGTTNGAKHFIRNQPVQTSHVGGYGMGPFGIGPYGQSYLLIDYGNEAADARWETGQQLIEAVVAFWDGFLARPT
jgi:hypothetical protein